VDDSYLNFRSTAAIMCHGSCSTFQMDQRVMCCVGHGLIQSSFSDSFAEPSYDLGQTPENMAN